MSEDQVEGEVIPVEPQDEPQQPAPATEEAPAEDEGKPIGAATIVDANPEEQFPLHQDDPSTPIA